MDHQKGTVVAIGLLEGIGKAGVDRQVVIGVGIYQRGGDVVETLRSLTVPLMDFRPEIA